MKPDEKLGKLSPAEHAQKQRKEEEAYNRGARMADDLICQWCGARGHSDVVCKERI